MLLILLIAATVLSGQWTASNGQEVRIPAYRPRLPNKPVVRIIPSDSVLIRLRKPESPKQGLGDSSVTRIKPILLAPPMMPHRAQLRDVLMRMRLYKMKSLIEKAKLQQFLEEAGPLVTLFAPTDEAFSLMSPPDDPARLRDFILQHMVKGRITPLDIRNDVTMASLRSGNIPLRFNVYEDGQILTVSGSQFLDDATDAAQVHVQPIDRVLYPISNEDLVTEVRLTFPRMYEFLLNSSLTSQLTSGTFTLFAPTDEAFEALTPDVRQKLLHNPTLMRKLLLNHVIPGTHYSAVLAHGYSLRSLGGDPIFFTNRRGLILANGMPIVKSDISVNNGVIHAVNRLLLPPELHTRRKPATVSPSPGRTHAHTPSRHNLYTPVQTYIEPSPPFPRTLTKTMSTPLQLPDGRKATFSTANSLFRRSLLMSTLRSNTSDQAFTILMPTDSAFEDLEPGALDRMRRNTRLLRRMLLHQMIEGKLDVSSNEKSTPVKSMGGTILISSTDGGKSLMAGGARVLSIRSASNGLVLVTDRVSFPPPPRTVFEALTPLVNLRRVLDRQPAIRNALAAVGTAYTIFAPTDEALSALTSEQQQDPKILSEIFWSHVVPGVYYRSQLTNGLQLFTLRGFTINIQHDPNGEPLVNGFPMVGDELLAGNGVIHKLNRVLFIPEQPPTSNGDSDPSYPVSKPEDELDKIARLFNATKFLALMNSVDMRNILQTPALRSSGCTLFLPTDSALNSMPPILRSFTFEDKRRLQKFIRYHLSSRPLHWDSIRDNTLLPTLVPGRSIRCNIYAKNRQPGVLSVSGCRVSAIRPLGGEDNNVTVAVIERVMAAPVGNLMLTASKSPMLSNFSKILKVAGADGIFEEGGSYTLFAPEACVFSKMDPQEYKQLISNKKLAREFVKQHLVRGCYYSNGFFDAQLLMTEAGTELTVKVRPDCILVSGARILYGNLNSFDGVLHVVSGRLPS